MDKICGNFIKKLKGWVMDIGKHNGRDKTIVLVSKRNQAHRVALDISGDIVYVLSGSSASSIDMATGHRKLIANSELDVFALDDKSKIIIPANSVEIQKYDLVYLPEWSAFGVVGNTPNKTDGTFTTRVWKTYMCDYDEYWIDVRTEPVMSFAYDVERVAGRFELSIGDVFRKDGSSRIEYGVVLDAGGTPRLYTIHGEPRSMALHMGRVEHILLSGGKFCERWLGGIINWVLDKELWHRIGHCEKMEYIDIDDDTMWDRIRDMRNRERRLTEEFPSPISAFISDADSTPLSMPTYTEIAEAERRR